MNRFSEGVFGEVRGNRISLARINRGARLGVVGLGLIVCLQSVTAFGAKSESKDKLSEAKAGKEKAAEVIVDMTGKVYDPKSDFKKVMFLFEKKLVREADGKLRATSRYMEKNGKTAILEETLYTADDQVIDFSRDHQQINRQTTVKREGKKLLFTLKEKNAKKEKDDTDDTDWEDNMIIPEQLTRYVHRHFDKIMSGETVYIRLIVPSRLETVGFRVFKEEDKEFGGKMRTRFRMSPTSVFIRALVDPVDLYFDKGEGRQLLMVDGRLPTKTFDKEGNYHDYVGQLVFEYKFGTE